MAFLREYYWLFALLLAAVGCKTASNAHHSDAPPTRLISSGLSQSPQLPPFAVPPPATWPQSVAAITFQEPLPTPAPGPPDSTHLEHVGDVLTREWLQAEVEARNPTIEAMLAAWQAAAKLYPQRVALDDPMLMGMIAPQSAGSSVTETAYALQLNQKLPWCGKRRLRGAIADADADAAFQEAEDSRLQVRLAADLAFFEYFLAARLLDINSENTRIAQQFLNTAQARYRTNQVTNQDVLQAELELADLARRQFELSRMHKVAMARINTLLRRWPDAPLPPPPAELAPPSQPADPNILWQTALQQRPDLAALAWRVESEQAALALACKNYHPDFDVFGRYDTFWQPSSTQGPLRGQVGMTMNLPIYREKLRAAVDEAQFRVNQRRAEFDQRCLEIQYEVLSAASQVEESRQTVELYARRLIPASEQNVAAARANYELSKTTFMDLALTQKQLISMRERQIETIVNYHRRLAELNRVTGGLVMQAP